MTQESTNLFPEETQTQDESHVALEGIDRVVSALGFNALMHYTTGAGLLGILQSKQLWATHINHMNDSHEGIGYYLHGLPYVLRQVVEDFLKNHPYHEYWKTVIEKNGFDLAVQAGVNAISEELRAKSQGMHVRYVTSFCGIKEDDSVVNRHGLLSQWRGYGHDGGYAIVFDADELAKKFVRWRKRNRTNLSVLMPVDYYFQDGSRCSSFTQLDHDAIKDAALSWMNMDTSKARKYEVYRAMALLPALAKHWGFSEEQEIRLVVNLPSEIQISTSESTLPKVPISFREVKGSPVPYIRVFAEDATPLPITKIIVGPHFDSKRRVETLKFTLEQLGFSAVSVVASEIPYRQ